MNTTRKLIIVACLMLGSTCAFSQALYSSPEPNNFSPEKVSKDAAIREAATVAPTCGYSKSYLTKNDLNELLSISKAVGVRIYNAKESAQQAGCDMIAVAVDASGKEIGKFLASKYLHAESVDENPSCPAKKVSQSKAQDFVKNVATSSLQYQKVFFSKAVIEARLAVAGSTGVVLVPGNHAEGSTMLMVAAKMENGKLTELESDFLRSLLPCPTDCGDSGNYLVAPN